MSNTVPMSVPSVVESLEWAADPLGGVHGRNLLIAADVIEELEAPVQLREPSKRKRESAAPLCTREIRAAFVLRGTSLSSWAANNGYSPQLVFMAISGRRRGEMSRRIVSELKEELGL